MSYSKVYVIDVPIRSISGTHATTEEDLGLAPGTLPPEELATLGNLIVVDKKVLAPVEKLRQRTKRLLEATGVRVGMGTVVTAADLQTITDRLKELQIEFYDAKAAIVRSFDDELDKRINEHPRYAALIRKYAPDVRRIERRLSFDIDTYKFDVPADDPNVSVLEKTLKRNGNDISSRLILEVADFVDTMHKGSIQKSQKLVKQNLGPLREKLLPKVKSFQLLDSSLGVISQYIDLFLRDVGAALDAKPTGKAFLDGADLQPFEQRLNVLRSVATIEGLIASSPRPSLMAPAKPLAAQPSLDLSVTVEKSSPQKRPVQPQTPSTGASRTAVRF